MSKESKSPEAKRKRLPPPPFLDLVEPRVIYFHHAHVDDVLLVWYRLVRSDGTEDLGWLTHQDAKAVGAVWPDQTKWLTLVHDNHPQLRAPNGTRRTFN